MAKGYFYCALDVASDKICVLLAKADNAGKITQAYTEYGKARGIKDGRISDIGLLAQAIAEPLNKLQVSSGIKVKSVHVCLRTANIGSRHSLAAIPLSERANKIITTSDIRKADAQAYGLGLNIEEEVLHQIPQGYKVDNQDKILNPEGIYGHKLETDLLLVFVLSADLENMITAISRAGFDVANVMLSGLASVSAVLSQEPKDIGCSFLDIGYDSVQMLTFKDGFLRGLDVFDFGLSSLALPLAEELKISKSVAEDIIFTHGSLLGIGSQKQDVLIKKDQGCKPVDRKLICSLIEENINDKFASLKEKFIRYHKQLGLQAGIIACGKMALIEGFLESIEASFGSPARLAQIGAGAQRGLDFAACYGIINHALSIRPRMNLFKAVSPGNILQKVFHKSKEIYQEYF